jgi:hypothetical protein
MNKEFVCTIAGPNDNVEVCCSCDNYTRYTMTFDEDAGIWRATITLKLKDPERCWYYVSYL